MLDSVKTNSRNRANENGARSQHLVPNAKYGNGKEQVMKTVPKSVPSYGLNLAVVLTALIVLVVPSAFAKHRESKRVDQPAAVIAHIALPGAPANQMLLQDINGKEYLYLVRNSRKGFTVVDVTRPSQPNLLKRVAWPDGASAGRLQLVSDTLGLAEGSSARSASPSEPAPETIELLDLSDPANPRTVQSFSGVTSILTDEGRRLIYITNSDGLWVLRGQPDKVVPHPCTSDDAQAAMPSCD
jgi:hypothetical protein